VFGNANDAPPHAPTCVTVQRDKDRRNAVVTWKPVAGAVGYNVRWGLRADRLNLSYQVFADKGATLELRALNIDQSYEIAVEAFNETGVSALSAVKQAN
jgi:xylan 1,4-beta-xylosidase